MLRGCLEKRQLLFNSVLTTWSLHFLQTLASIKALSLKTWYLEQFRYESQKRTISYCRSKFGSNGHSSCIRVVFLKRFYLFLPKQNFWNCHGFLRKLVGMGKFFKQLVTNYFGTYQLSPLFPFTTRKTGLHYHQKLNLRATSRVSERPVT